MLASFIFHTTAAAVLEREISWVPLLYENMDRGTQKHVHPTTASKICQQTQSLSWAGGWHYSDFSEPRHEVLCDVCVFSCRGGQRSSVHSLLTFCSLFVRRTWDKSSGILLRTFSGHYECLLLLHSSGRWWALCKYLGPLQLNHLTTDDRRNSGLTLFCFE